MKHFVRWICGTAVLTLLFSRYLPLGWPVILSSAIAAGVLTAGLSWSDASWTEAFLAVFVFEFVVGNVNTMDEAIFFHLVPVKLLSPALAGGLVVSLLLGVVLAFVPPLRNPPAARRREAPSKMWTRVPLLVVAYVVIYFIAGLIVRPYVIACYRSYPLPGLGELLVVEAIRGLLYLGAAWPWLWLLRANRLRAAVFLGAAYSIIGGIAPLLLPNPLMPAHIRLAHGIEIGISNFLFGVLVGCLLLRKPVPVGDRVTQPALS